MALFSGFVLAGTGAGPLVGSAFMETLGQTTLAWKWTFWHQVMLDGMLFISCIFLFKESPASVLLSKKAKKLNQWYEELEANGVFGMYLLGSSMPVPARSASSSDTCLSSGANDLEQDFVTASVK